MSVAAKSDVVDVTRWTSQRLDWHLQICSDPTLPGRAKLLASLLLHDFDLRRGGFAWRAQWSSDDGEDTLSKRAGWKTKTTVQLAAKELEAASYIRIKRGQGRGRSNHYWPVFRTEKGDPDPPFSDPEKAYQEPPFRPEKAYPDPVKGIRTSPLHRKDSANSPAKCARASGFERLVEVCPKGMLKFADLALARRHHDDLGNAGEDLVAITAGLERMGVSAEYLSRKHPPQLHAWLGKGMWRGWLAGSDELPPATASDRAVAVRPFTGPPAVEAAVLAVAPQAAVCLAGAAWRGADRTILVRTSWAADQLVERVTCKGLAALELRVEVASSASTSPAPADRPAEPVDQR
ncbi:hypothetical protein [uncultured Phenylobacterium sp.]|uniref:hypothetical protein n=1 Tax=uncultured Phenylobacterium sp. TaxID=349273 RepID=UPI0025EB2F74|nr:hypothetical protein [uncultured Phenylobacterium sp.]